MNTAVALILAAGKGTRMHSDKPKVLQSVLGEPMLAHVLTALRPFFAERIVTVIGHNADMVRKAFVHEPMHYVLQEEQKGTGHALMQAMPTLQEQGYSHALVINGDVPLVSSVIIENFITAAQNAHVAFATLELPEAGAYGRVVRKNGAVQAIVEAKDYDANIHGQDPKEVNAGLYYLHLDVIEKLLPHLHNENKSGEYYITDLVGLAVQQGYAVEGISCGADESLFGVNSPVELAQSEENLRARMVEKALTSGVIIHAPNAVYISPKATLAPGAEIFGPCNIVGASSIERGAVIHTNCYIKDSHIHADAHILPFSHVEKASVGEGASVGPYGRLRPGAVLEEKSKVGNFVEVKKATLGIGAKVNHLSYIGDAHVGSGANVGAGTITCNYDGKNKFQTHIGENAFIGSNSALVAPVNIGDGALVGAGSVITKDIQAEHIGIGRARQTNLPRRLK